MGNDGREIVFSANAEERAALAQRFDLADLATLTGKAQLSRVAGGRVYRLSASFEADVIQTCVVTLEPMPARVSESFTLTFAPAEEIERPNEVVIGDEEDPPEPLIDGTIDIGEAVAEHLCLALDPFPRKEAAVIPEPYVAKEDVVDDERPHPFAALAELKKRLEG